MMELRNGIHAAWAIGALALILSSAVGCGSREVREIRADFDKIPDFFLGKRSGGQSFVRYTYARIGDIPDESCRLQLLHEFTDRLFAFDFKEHFQLEKLEWRELRDAARIVENGLRLLRSISEDSKARLMGFNIPLTEYWGTRFRYLETERSCREWMARRLNRPLDMGNHNLEISCIEQEMLSDREHGRLSSDDFSKVRTRLEQILGRPMRTQEQLDEERKNREKGIVSH